MLYDLGTFLAVFVVALLVAGLVIVLWRLMPFRRGGGAAERLVIGQIATVVRQGLPLAAALSLAAQSERGEVRARLAAISKYLAQGLSLSKAVRVGYPDCPGMALSLICAGENAGQLSAALDQAETYLLERDSDSRRIDPSIGPYAFIVMSWTVLVMSLVLVVVTPKLAEIYADFDVDEPLLLRGLARGVERRTPVLVTMLVTIGMGTVVLLYLRLRPRRVPQLGSISRLADWVRWHMPGARRVEFGVGMSVMLRTMRFAVRSGMKLDEAARLASTVDVNWNLRQRMDRFAKRLTGGTDPRQAADDAQLGEIAALALSGGQRFGDMDSALRYAADYYSTVISRWWAMVKNVSWPLCTLALASVVGSMVYMLFQPLVALIDSVMDSGGM